MDSNKLTRFGVSMDESLLLSFDQLILQKGYKNRSEAVRYLVRDALVKERWVNDEEVAGTIMLFYDHHRRNLVDEMLNIQHDYHHQIMATTHFHIDHNDCLELIVVKGRASELKELSDRITTLKGVKYGKLTVAPLATE